MLKRLFFLIAIGFILIAIDVNNNNKVEAVKILIWSGGATWAGFGLNPFTTPNYLGQNLIKPECPVECTYVHDRKEFDESDAILLEAQPFSGFGYAYLKSQPALPQKNVNQYYINFGFEHDIYFPIFGEPGFHNHIDINSTFQQDQSEVPITFTCSWGSYDTGSLQEFQLPSRVATKDKNPYIGFMASNCAGGGAIFRTCYLKEMMKEIRVDAMGMCLHNFDLDDEDNSHHLFADLGDSFRIKRKVLGKYMFSIAFENNNKTDYVTEKVYTSLLSGSVPIYMGAPNIDEYVPKNSIIKTDDFKSPSDLIKHLKYLIENTTAYEEYFNWKKEPLPEAFAEKYKKCIFYGADCRLCQKVHEKMQKNIQVWPPGHRTEFGEPESVKIQKRMISLDKSTSCLVIKQNATIPPIEGSFSILLWIQPYNLEYNSKLISLCDGKVEISIHTVWKRDFLRYCWGPDHCFVNEIPINSDEWKHVAIVVKPSQDIVGVEEITFYINGNFDSSYKTNAKPHIPSGNIKLGCDNGNRGFMGKVDDLTIWNRALSKKEVSQSMFKKFRGDEQGLLHYLTFNDVKPIDYSKYRASIEYKDIITQETEEKKLDLNCC